MKKEEERTGKILLQDNWLSRSVYTLNAYQNMAYLHILYQAQKSYQRSETEFLSEKSYPVELDYVEMKELIPDKRKRHYKEVHRLFTVLQSTPIIWKAMEEEEGQQRTVIEAYELDKEGNLVVFLNGLVIKHIISHTSYTALNLLLMQEFRTFKAQRLYELLRFWSQPKEYRVSQEYTVVQLREFLGVENKYAAYKEFKRCILKKAIEEIADCGKMQITMQEIKHRVNQVKVEKIKFTMYDSEPRSYGAKSGARKRKNESAEAIEAKVATQSGKQKEKELVASSEVLPDGLPFSSQVYERFAKENGGKIDYRKEGIRKRQLEEAAHRTLKQLNISKITMKQYAYFQVVLKSLEETVERHPIDDRKLALLNRKKQSDLNMDMDVVEALRKEQK